VSSYTPTLTAIIDDVRPRAQSKPKVLAVALPVESRLPSVQTEVDNIGKYSLLSKLLETEATVTNVVKGMKEANWVHFACHGIQDISDPTKSALLLAGGAHLTLSEISKLSLPHAELAYLSACQTATGAEDLSEEAVHLTAGMLLAGYRGVVGTMWSIKDDDAPKVADAVYAELFKDPHPDPSLTAFALQEAVKKLCNESTEKKSFLAWVPYIHVGL
jgi:CHAT domain-containing protein